MRCARAILTTQCRWRGQFCPFPSCLTSCFVLLLDIIWPFSKTMELANPQKTVLSVELLLFSPMSRLIQHTVQASSGDCIKPVLEPWKGNLGEGWQGREEKREKEKREAIPLMALRSYISWSAELCCEVLILSYTQIWLFLSHIAVTVVIITLDMNVKDRKYSAWFLPKLSLDLLHPVLLWMLWFTKPEKQTFPRCWP